MSHNVEYACTTGKPVFASKSLPCVLFRAHDKEVICCASKNARHKSCLPCVFSMTHDKVFCSHTQTNETSVFFF
jgi:hypothetical protein